MFFMCSLFYFNFKTFLFESIWSPLLITQLHSTSRRISRNNEQRTTNKENKDKNNEQRTEGEGKGRGRGKGKREKGKREREKKKKKKKREKVRKQNKQTKLFAKLTKK
mmetsp:Transcript_38580/g.53741  ORF Transcript_38580/g.53741 Transcript_38580/m.53741 type:complete len:108 (-) Transcript_38580:10-333(-)